MAIRLRILDGYCGAGGAGAGYHRAGCAVTGVDIDPQRHYPFPFVRKNFLDLDPEWIRANFDGVHASPPCQGYSKAVTSADSQWVPTRGRNEPRLIEPTRALLRATGLPYVIENVMSAFERAYVERVLTKHNGNVVRAAAASGIARRYFYVIKSRQDKQEKP
jgi:DNA (cytosine-5)-methyltransferase 1